MKYEDVAWHSGSDDYPKDLPAQAAATHTGMFIAWALTSGLGSTLLAADAGELRARKVTPGAFFYSQCDGKFTDEDLNDEGNAFAKLYFDPEVAMYLGDYDAVLCSGLKSAYHVPDTWSTAGSPNGGAASSESGRGGSSGADDVTRGRTERRRRPPI